MVIKAGLQEFDIIGISYYAFWHGTFEDVKNSMESLAARYHKPVIIAETAHPWRRCEDGFVTEEQEEIAGFCAGIEEQVQVMRLTMNIAASITDGMGQGVYYWEPLVLPIEGQGSWGNNMGMLSLDGKALPGFKEFQFERKDYNPEEIEIIYHIQKEEDAKKEEARNSWKTEKDSFVEMKFLKEESCLYIEAKQNFHFQITQNVPVLETGRYCMGVSYRGTNTTDVDVRFFEKQNTGMEDDRKEKRIYPTDDRWMVYELNDVLLTEGTVTLGIDIVSPPVMGKIKNFFLYKIEE